MFIHVGITGSIVVCISPLTSLMVDQQKKFSALGLKTEYVGIAQHSKEVKERVLKGDVQLLYISPECLLLNKTYRNMLLSEAYQQRLVTLTVDEAHCGGINFVQFSLK